MTSIEKSQTVACNFCHQTFTSRTDLKGHVWTHLEEKSPSCKECDMTFSSTSCLKEHEETHHVKNTVAIVESHKMSAVKHDQKDPDETQTKGNFCLFCNRSFPSCCLAWQRRLVSWLSTYFFKMSASICFSFLQCWWILLSAA